MTWRVNLPSNDDDLVHHAHPLHHGGHVAPDLLRQGDDIGVLLGGEGLGLGVVAVDGDAEVVARGAGGARGVGRVHRHGDLGLAHDVALRPRGGERECALSGGGRSEDGGARGAGETGNRSSGGA